MTSNRLAEYERPKAPAGATWASGGESDKTLQKRMGSLMDQATTWVKEHPEIALAAAVVTGVVVGWLIKRR